MGNLWLVGENLGKLVGSSASYYLLNVGWSVNITFSNIREDGIAASLLLQSVNV